MLQFFAARMHVRTHVCLLCDTVYSLCQTVQLTFVFSSTGVTLCAVEVPDRNCLLCPAVPSSSCPAVASAYAFKACQCTLNVALVMFPPLQQVVATRCASMIATAPHHAARKLHHAACNFSPFPSKGDISHTASQQLSLRAAVSPLCQSC